MVAKFIYRPLAAVFWLRRRSFTMRFKCNTTEIMPKTGLSWMGYRKACKTRDLSEAVGRSCRTSQNGARDTDLRNRGENRGFERLRAARQCRAPSGQAGADRFAGRGNEGRTGDIAVWAPSPDRPRYPPKVALKQARTGIGKTGYDPNSTRKVWAGARRKEKTARIGLGRPEAGR